MKGLPTHDNWEPEAVFTAIRDAKGCENFSSERFWRDTAGEPTPPPDFLKGFVRGVVELVEATVESYQEAVDAAKRRKEELEKKDDDELAAA
jgi:hypothetical protein